LEKKEKILEFIIGRQRFSKSEKGLEYRYTLLVSMLFASIIMLSFAVILRVLSHHLSIALLDFTIMLLVTYQFITLRKNKRNFKKISNYSIGIYYILFTAILFVVDSEIKLIWFANLITAAYLLRGYRYGFQIAFLSISTVVFAHVFSPFDINLNHQNVLFAITSYLTVAIFLRFSEIEHRKNLINIKKSSRWEKIARKKLYDSLRVDPLTNLPNKIALSEEIKSKSKGSLIVFAIEDYDLMQDQFGEEYMRSKIKEIADILKRFDKNGVRLYHLFENRFAFFMNDFSNDKDKIFAKHINSLFEEKNLDDNRLDISISFKTVVVREGKNSLSKAILTLNRKDRLNSDIFVYQNDPKQEQVQKNNLYWNKRLPQLIKEDMIVPYFQPIVDNSSGEIVKYEALVRAIDGDKIISPYLFLDTAKSKGLLTTITKIVIDKSFFAFKDKSYDISINITDDDLKDGYLTSYLEKKSIEYGIEPKRVYLEVLENINSSKCDYVNEQFNRLKEIGFGISIDDFGSEASNFSRLMTLKADIIKIDGQFIKNLDNDLNSHKIIEAIVLLSNKMGAKTVAEFVHSKEIYKIVKMLGIDYSQGFYFSEPIEANMIENKEMLTF